MVNLCYIMTKVSQELAIKGVAGTQASNNKNRGRNGGI